MFRYDGGTGAFIDKFTTAPSGAEGIRWRKNFVYVSSHVSNDVLKFDGRTGALIGPVVAGGFLDWATGFDFGPDGNIYVASFFDDSVMKFNFQTGQFMGVFAINCFGPELIAFGPNGDLYVASYFSDSVDVFDGVNGTRKRSIFGQGLDGPFGVAFRSR